MKKFGFVICAVMALAGAISVRAITPEYKYVFVPSAIQNTTTDPFLNSEWGGTLNLDAPMNLTGGSISDIDLGASSLQTPFGSFSLSYSSPPNSPPVIQSVGGVPVPFTWTTSLITSMNITGAGPLNVSGSLYSWQITQSSIEIGLNDPTVVGAWVASGTSGVPGVPDSTSTALLIGLAAAAMCGFGSFNRIRPLAMARARNLHNRFHRPTTRISR
jgi:hypothetical protein